jgi:valyl-tRNA synthetase
MSGPDHIITWIRTIMNDLDKTYQPAQKEELWYAYWIAHGFFKSKPDNREPFTIVIPPPNVTGVLHMGHMLNNTIQDILIRKARMEGKNACWVPGTDHASIATEAKVVALLREKGIKKRDISREEFLEHAFAWKEKYGGIILEQLKKLGASCDWDRTRFTMEESLSDAVTDSFITLYNKGLIYRDLKMVNWDPAAQTTLSNEEVIYKDEQNPIYYIQYKLEGADQFLTVATVRPETIPGDVAVCVHPDDERYQPFIGKRVHVPLVNRLVPVIADPYVDMTFGTGVLKITPAHDLNDYEIGKKYNLEVIDCFMPDGTIAPAAGVFVGSDRFVARKAAVKQLAAEGLLLKSDITNNRVGYSERTHVPVEPRLSLQWFVRMDELVKPALENVLNDVIRFYPDRYKNLYKHWLENIRDWPISRQLWWGQRIPAWYLPNGEVAVCKTKEEAVLIFEGRNITFTPEDIRQDEDVVDTWFSSWLWPISVFDGFKDPSNPEIQYYYPTSVLVTGWDIIFFWVARMIFAGYAVRGEKPFHKVYFTGMVRDKLRRKMSKSLGNSPDTLKLIQDYGADGVRFGVMSAAAAGNDLLFDEKQPEQGRNFCNKIWNALRLIQGWVVVEDKMNTNNVLATEWINSRLNQTIAEVHSLFDDFRLSEALMTLYKFIWDDFCSWYLELIKPDYQQPIDRFSRDAALDVMEKMVRLLHPFMPFITEEIWHRISPRAAGESICISTYPQAGKIDKQLIEQAQLAFEIVTNIREVRARAQKKNQEMVDVYWRGNYAVSFAPFSLFICRLARVEKMTQLNDFNPDWKQFMVKGYEFAVNAGNARSADDLALMQKELDYTLGFLESINKKLNNEKFMASAKPEIIENEKKKKEDALQKVSMLKKNLGQD